MNQGGGGNQTVTQQNIPDWAMGYARDTLQMGNEYTMDSNYRPTSLDYNYGNLRGSAPSQRNSGRPVPTPAAPGALDGLMAQLPPDMQGRGLNIGRRPGTGLKFADQMPSTGRSAAKYAAPTTGPAATPGGDFNNTDFGGASSGQTSSENQGDDGYWDWYRALIAEQKKKDLDESDSGYDITSPAPGSWQASDGLDEFDSGYDITSPPAVDGGLEFSSEDSWIWGSGNSGNNDNISSSSDSSSSNTSGNTGVETASEEEPTYEFDASKMTPFQIYDRQRFAAPNANTTRGEGILAGRYDQRFGENGVDPFAGARSSIESAANYSSGYTPYSVDATGPQANQYNNQLGRVFNANGYQGSQYGNANQGISGPVNYQQGTSLAQNIQNFQDPYTDQVVNQTIRDMDRARKMTDMDISSNASRAGSYGGSREALMRAENARNYADRTAAAVGQLRSQGFQKAADLAQTEQLQRLGLTAQDLQNVRGLNSQGNLQGQQLTAQDLQNTRGLNSQGALAAQALRAQGQLNAQNLGAQSDRDAMNYGNQLLMQQNQLGVNQANTAESFRQGAGALNLQGGNALGALAQASTADERSRITDLLAAGQAGDARAQQELDFIYSEFNRELDYPGRQIDLRNAAISPATGSIVQTTQPRYQSNPLLGAAGTGLSAYGMTQNPYAAGVAALFSLLYDPYR